MDLPQAQGAAIGSTAATQASQEQVCLVDSVIFFQFNCFISITFIKNWYTNTFPIIVKKIVKNLGNSCSLPHALQCQLSEFGSSAWPIILMFIEFRRKLWKCPVKRVCTVIGLKELVNCRKCMGHKHSLRGMMTLLRCVVQGNIFLPPCKSCLSPQYIPP